MRERVALLLIIAGLVAFLIVFQNFFNTFWAVIFLLAFMVVYLFYSYIATKYQRRKIRKNPPVINHDYKPFVSILIPAHNEAEVIRETVLNIMSLDYENYEIILIDDRSSDGTALIVQNLCKEFEKIECLVRHYDALPGKSAVLNDAIKIAKGDLFLVFDADARVAPDFLKIMLPLIEPKDVGAVQARKNIINYKQNFLTRCQYNEFATDTGLQISRDATRGAVELRGNGELIKREVIEDVGGWNNNTLVDDLDLSTRMHIKGWDIRFCPQAVVWEEGVITFTALIRQRRRWVEGSIRRYLEFSPDVLFSKDMPLRVSLDLVAYISQFLLPFWVTVEVLLQMFRFVKGYDNTILSSALLVVCLFIFFTMTLMYSLRKYSGYSLIRAFCEAAVTAVYIVVFWIPIVMFIILKIIFRPRTMDWGKTQHGVATVKCFEGFNVQNAVK